MNLKAMLRGLSAAALVLLATASAGAKEQPYAKPFTAPELREWAGRTGTLTIAPDAAIVYNSDALKPVAELLAQQYGALTGTTPAVRQGKPGKDDIVLTLKANRKLGAEGYTLAIDKRVDITAATAEGARWGAMTLLQMLRSGNGLPKGTATDWPMYGVRGLMMDAGRKYIPLDYLYKLVDDMAYYKLNRLHMHLNDNGFKYYFDEDWDKTQAAFRMESDVFPGLGARDGSYSKEDYRAFQRYAAERGVDVVSEIDVPAHALALTRYNPATASTDGRNGVDHLNLDAPETYEMLDKLIEEYIGGEDPVFTSPRFHIGTDEYQGDSLTMEKFRAFTDRYIKYVQQFGKEPLIWGSLTHAKGQTPIQVDGVEMYLWSNGYADPQQMLDLGYDVVSIPDSYVYIVPSAGYYYDYLNNELIYDGWTPAQIGRTKIEEGHPQLRGGMFAVWNDHPNNGLTVRDIHHRVMHSLPAMAAKTWDGDQVTVPFAEFEAKRASLGEAPGVNYLAVYPETPVVVEMAELKPGTELPVEAIGYDYTVEFDIEGKAEERGTVLFSNGEATVWLSDPITGNMGYSREDHLNSYRHDIRPGEKAHIRIDGNNEGTTLYVNGKLVDRMNTRWYSFNNRNKMAEVRTLVFPLKQAGKFNSKITNLRVSNSVLPVE